ncbi:MAG: acyl-CoA thioester hydrolase/BAAT C-terminal domain-containing protein [Corynebacterium sp.]|nr:acyl-CoA thioester hydrolase/BAAT C-terminal domain-containing protein [Corynebacterium sp.]
MDINLRPISGLNESLHLTVTELTPGDTLRVKVDATDAAGRSWQSESEFTANSEGIVDFDSSLPHSAAWSPANSLGLLWAMSPERPEAFSLSGVKPVSVDFKIRSSNDGRGAHAQRTLARAVEEWNFPKLHAQGFSKKGSDPRPLILLFDEGSAPATAAAAYLADSGFSVLSIDYQEFKKFEDLTEAVATFRQDKTVNSTEPISLIGLGEGAVVALLLAERLGDTVGPVIAHNPANHIVPALSTKPTDLWKDLESQGTIPSKNDMKSRAREAALKGLAMNIFGLIPPSEFNELPVKNIAGPVLLTASTDDAVWDSVTMAKTIAEDCESNGIQVFHLEYAGAGHGTGFPFSMPGVPAATVATLWDQKINLGGSRIINSQRAVDSMEQVMSMLNSYYGL